MTNIIVLLQLAISLLSNPKIQANPVALNQANTFAIQAISLARAALNPQPTPVTPTTVQSSLEPTQIPQVSGGPSLAPDVPFVQPSCSLVASGDRNITVSWTSQAVSLPGTLYEATGQDGGNLIYMKIDDLLTSEGTRKGIAKLVPSFKAVFGQTECYTSINE